MSDTEKPLEAVFERVLEDADDKVSLRDVLESFDDRSFGPLYVILGLATVIPPLGAVPALPSIIGIIIAMFSIQMLFGRSHIWLPDFMLDQSISQKKIKTAHEKSSSTLEAVDRVVTKRFAWAVSGGSRYIAAFIVTIFALLMVPLELVPFAVAIPGSAIALIGVALIARDGAIMLLAYTISITAFAAMLSFAFL